MAIHRIVNRTRDVRTLRSRIPEELAWICRKALEKDRDRRYADIAGFSADLRSFLDHRPVAARPRSRLRTATGWVRDHPGTTVILGLGLIALAVESVLLIGSP